MVLDFSDSRKGGKKGAVQKGNLFFYATNLYVSCDIKFFPPFSIENLFFKNLQIISLVNSQNKYEKFFPAWHHEA